MSATAFQRMRRNKAKTSNTEMKENTQQQEVKEVVSQEEVHKENQAPENEEVKTDGEGTSEAGGQEGHETEKQPEAQGPAENVDTEGQAPEAKPLSEYVVVDLKEMAKEQNIEGYSTMKKPELIKALGGE
ncbi:Rho termination factor N-terminal domain-containing protein [Planococcus dechangensis]|uniref:Rho termination factor N-terminal domain-containing protein n=1 Tax=Planococcus dechangensis TaxID=1176255 RepID=A0ABV9M8U8_9BACL